MRRPTAPPRTPEVDDVPGSLRVIGRSLEQWLRLQEGMHPRAIQLGLDRIRVVATRLDLQHAFPYTLSVAGTNGKGSSATLAAGIYRAAGYSVGLYTSPHVLRYNERIQINGQPVGDEPLCEAFAAIDAARAEVPLTYFEFGTLAALWLFRAARVDVQVLEVGLGGRLDAVNLVDADCALLSNVGLDHQDWLGTTREQIGVEKAGIFRSGKPAIVVEREPPQSVLDAAARLSAPLQRLGCDFDYQHERDGRWHWHAQQYRLDDLPAPGLAGAIQYQNAAGVLAAIAAGHAQRPVAPEAIAQALPALRLRGRCESYRGVLLDVAHNEEAAQVLAGFLRERPVARRVMVLGMLADKPVEAVMTALRAVVDVCIVVGLPGPRGIPAAELQQRVQAAGVDAQSCDTIAEALRQARVQAGADGEILATGSFLTVAAAIEALDQPSGNMTHAPSRNRSEPGHG